MRTQKILVLVVLALFTLVSANALAVDEAVEEEILWTRAVVAANRSQRLLNTLKLSDKEIEALQRRTAEDFGFRLVGHKLELYGVRLASKTVDKDADEG